MQVTGTVNSNTFVVNKGKKIIREENEKYILTSKSLHNIIVQHEKRRNSIHQSPGVG